MSAWRRAQSTCQMPASTLMSEPLRVQTRPLSIRSVSRAPCYSVHSAHRTPDGYHRISNKVQRSTIEGVQYPRIVHDQYLPGHSHPTPEKRPSTRIDEYMILVRSRYVRGRCEIHGKMRCECVMNVRGYGRGRGNRDTVVSDELRPCSERGTGMRIKRFQDDVKGFGE